MEGVEITIEDLALRTRAESLLSNGDYIESIICPTTESPFPLWIWHDQIKMWIGDRWKNVGVFKRDTKDIRINQGLIRIKE